jgi:hypothetical protein
MGLNTAKDESRTKARLRILHICSRLEKVPTGKNLYEYVASFFKLHEFQMDSELRTFLRCRHRQPQKPFLQHGPERRVHVAEFNPHAKSISGVRHRCVALKKIRLRANFHEDCRPLGERIRHGEIRSKDVQVFDTGGPCVR